LSGSLRPKAGDSPTYLIMPLHIGKILVIFGLVLFVLGVLFLFVEKIPFLGKLPGDIHIHKKGWEFYFPLTTSILISIVLSIVLILFGRFFRR
jgi:hypothetical protein